MTKSTNYDIIRLDSESYLVYFLGEFLMDKKQTYTFVTRSILGKCPCCKEIVYDNTLYVLDGSVFHFACYNEKKNKEKEEK